MANRILCVVATVAVSCWWADAYSRYQSQLPNTPPNHPALGHTAASSGSGLNGFGRDFKSAGHKWTTALCQKDSDGDGQSNGLELGDPYCVWSVGKTPFRTSQISDPSLFSSTTTASSTPAPPTTKAITTPAPPTTRSPPGVTPAPTTAAPKSSTAAPSTMTPASTAGLTAAGSGTVTLFPGMSMNWTYYQATAVRRSAVDLVEVSFSVQSDEWVGFGPSPSAMQGNQVICVVRADGTGACADIQTDATYSVTDRSPVTQVVSAERTGSGYQMTVQTPASSLGGDLTTLQRTIFAKGVWDPSIDYPLQHSSGDVLVRKVNFFTGTVSGAARSRFDWIVIGVAVGIVLLSCCVAAVIHRSGYIPTPHQSQRLWAAAYLTLGFLVIAVYVAAGIGYHRDGMNAPWGRALGAALTFLFFLVLWPTTRYVGAAHLLGISYDKVLPLHIAVGTAIALVMTAHFGWMGVVYAKNGQATMKQVLFGWNTSDTTKPLAGFICWVAMMLMFIPATTIRRIAFGAFKLSHLLFPIVLLFGALHYTPMWIAIAPGLVGYAIDVTVRLVHYLKAREVSNAVYHQAAGVTELSLRLPTEPTIGPGQYLLVGLSELSPMLHPFTVADYRQGVARCFVKAAGGWTKRLAARVSANESLGELRVLGPFGSLDVPLDMPKRIVCVAGGIGITPMISILQHLSTGAYKNVTEVRLIWACPSLDLVRALSPVMREHLVRLRGLVTLDAVVHVTRLQGAAESVSAGCGGSTVLRVEGGRPNLLQYFSPYEGTETKEVAAYVCGPTPMTEAVRSIAFYLNIHLHTETFEY